MRRFRSVGLALVMLWFVASLTYPWLDRHWFADRRVFTAVVAHQEAAIRVSRGGKTVTRLLCLTWFWNGSIKHALSTTLWSDGRLTVKQTLVGIGPKEGSDLKAVSRFAALRTLPPLPHGLSGPNACPADKLLLVSQQEGSVWGTRYYDRTQLPPKIFHIGDLLHINLREGRFPSGFREP